MSHYRNLSEIAAHLRGIISSADIAPQARPQIDDLQFGSLSLELFARQFEANPVYRTLCASRGATPDTVKRWTDIPAIAAAGFKEFDLTCIPPAERIAEFYSSGTTGHKPSRHFHGHASLELYEASLWAWFRRHLLPNLRAQGPPGLVILTPGPGQAPNSSLVHMFDTVRKQTGASTSAFLGTATARGWVLNCGGVFDRLASLVHPADTPQTRPRPILLLGTALSFLELMDYMAETKETLCLPLGSRVMETGGYKGRSRSLTRAELHSRVQHRLGVPLPFIISEYGMSELSSQAYATSSGPVRLTTKAETKHDLPPRTSPSPREPVYQFPPWARARVVSPETGAEIAEGETGLIQVYDLANVFSVMAIQTEDLGVKRGTGFELLGRADSAPRGCSLHVAPRGNSSRA